MRTSNESDGNSFGKLALLASAAATAAFVISQSRLLERIGMPSPRNPQPSPEPEIVPEVGPTAGAAEDDTGHDAAPAKPDTANATLAQAKADTQDDDTDRHDPPPPAGGAGGSRLRFRTRRPARERGHYGLPVQHRRASIGVASPTDVSETAGAETPEVVADADFDADYLAIVEVLTQDDSLDVDDQEYVETVEAIIGNGRPASMAVVPVEAVLPAVRDVPEVTTWIPAPRLSYIFAGLLVVAAAAVAGSDPVTLAGEGIVALSRLNDTSDLLLLGWIVCGLLVLLPIGAIATGVVSLASRGKVYLPGAASADALDSAGWGVRILAMSAFVAGIVLYTPHALGWALDTDHPVASVTSSSMSPALQQGELVLIEGVASIDELTVGEIIAFENRRGLSFRRIAEIGDDAVVVSADARPGRELEVAFEDIAGRVLTVAGTQIRVPLLGDFALIGEDAVEPPRN